MRKKLSVILSYLLCLAMLLTPATVTGFADELSLSEEEGFAVSEQEALTEDFLSEGTAFEEELTEDAETPEDELLLEEPQDDTAENALKAAQEAAEDAKEAELIASLPEGVPYLKLAKPHIMYGEDGSNKNGNLDRSFSPVYILNKTEYTELTVSYKFSTDLALKDTVTPESFENLTGEKLEDLKAGTEVLAIVKASPADAEPAVSTVVFTIEKRKIRILLSKNRELEVSEKELPEEGTVTVTAGDEIYGSLIPAYTETAPETAASETAASDETEVSAAAAEESLGLKLTEEDPAPDSCITVDSDAFVHAEELAALSDSILSGDIVYDVSAIDGKNPGYQQVPLLVSLTPELAENYVAEDALGYVYVTESSYWITFEAVKNGVVQKVTYQNTIYTHQDLSEFLTDARKTEILSLNPKTAGYAWALSTNGNNGGNDVVDDTNCSIYYLTTDFKFRLNNTDYDFTIQPRQDYYLRAIQDKKITDGLTADVISSVYYDGRAHVTSETGLKGSALKSKINDLFVMVSYPKAGGGSVPLTFGKDYTVTYKNNKNASLKMKETGEYEKAYTSDDQRPCVIITGKGNFKGFKTTVYFDILPYNFGYVSSLSNGPLATVSGLKHSYALKDGKISGSIKPTVKIKFSKSYTLKNGTDYKSVIYKAEGGKWVKQAIKEPSEITSPGSYLYTAQGINNYCGTVFGQTEPRVSFNDGTKTGEVSPAICTYTSGDLMECQFIVKDNTKLDLANAKISVGKKSKPYVNGTFYTGADFKIKVKAGSAELTEGTDYRIIYDGVDYTRFVGKDATGSFLSMLDSSEFENKVQMANLYKIKIVAIDGNTNGYFGSQSSSKTVRVSGIKLKSSWFQLDGKKTPYNGNPSTGTYRWSSSSKVSTGSPAGVLPASTVGGYTLYDYGDNFSNYYDLGASYANKVCVMSEFDILPGTYTMAVYPFGPGVNHDKTMKIKYTRTAISMDTAIKNNLVKVTAAANATYNAGGSLPSRINIYYNGKWTNNLELHYNGQAFTVYDKYVDYNLYYPTTIKVYAKNNTKPGTKPYFVLQGDGKVFKGKSKTKSLTFTVDPALVNYSGIEVLDANDYVYSHGKPTVSISNYSFDNGKVYAMMTPIEKTSKNMDSSTNLPKKDKVKVTLYQACCKNEAEYNEGRMSLAKIGTGQYDLALSSISGETNAFLVTVKNKSGKTPPETGFNFGDDGIALLAHYTVYDKAVKKIKSVTVKKGSETYILPDDSSKPITFTGGAITFDQIVSATLDNGEVVEGSRLRAEYTKNVATGKGTVTVYLKKDPAVPDFKFGGSGKFTFTIQKSADSTF